MNGAALVIERIARAPARRRARRRCPAGPCPRECRTKHRADAGGGQRRRFGGRQIRRQAIVARHRRNRLAMVPALAHEQRRDQLIGRHPRLRDKRAHRRRATQPAAAMKRQAIARLQRRGRGGIEFAEQMAAPRSRKRAAASLPRASGSSPLSSTRIARRVVTPNTEPSDATGRPAPSRPRRPGTEHRRQARAASPARHRQRAWSPDDRALARIAQRLVCDAALHGERALRRRRQHPFDCEQLGDRRVKAKADSPAHASTMASRSRPTRARRVGTLPRNATIEVVADQADLRGPASAAGPDASAGRQRLERQAIPCAERVLTGPRSGTAATVSSALDTTGRSL